jgi:hypothetical protein
MPLIRMEKTILSLSIISSIGPRVRMENHFRMAATDRLNPEALQEEMEIPRDEPPPPSPSLSAATSVMTPFGVLEYEMIKKMEAYFQNLSVSTLPFTLMLRVHPPTLKALGKPRNQARERPRR